MLLVGVGAALAAYGGWLLWPLLPAAAVWLVAGPLVHDVVVAPVVGLAGLLLARLVRDRAVRWLLGVGLAMTATLLLIAVPLIWRPHPAAPNPGLQDRDYVSGLLWWLGVLWTTVLIAVASTVALWRTAASGRG